MKFKSITILLSLLLFIIGITEFIMLFMKLEVPTTLITISTILLFTLIISSYIQNLKLRKLVYPIIIIFYLLGMPIIESFLSNKSLYIGFTILSFGIIMVFIYKDLMLTNKEKKIKT